MFFPRQPVHKVLSSLKQLIMLTFILLLTIFMRVVKLVLGGIWKFVFNVIIQGCIKWVHILK